MAWLASARRLRLTPGLAAKHAARGTGGVVVAGVAGLWAAKAASPPEPPECWWQARRQPAESGSAAAVTEAGTLQALADAGVRIDELQAAACASWNGVELAVEAAAAAGLDVLRASVARWRAIGTLAPQPRRPAVPETRRTYGTDVGSTAPVYLGRASELPWLGGRNLNAALETLRADGVAVVGEVVPKVQLLQLRRRLRVLGGGGPLACPPEVPTGDILAAALGASPPLEPTIGRRHFLLRGTALAEEDLGPLLAPLMPLAYRYFAEQRPEVPPGSLLVAAPPALAEAADAPRPRLFLSECQLLVSDPGAVAQMWHRDNRKPGLSVLLPFTDVDAEVGATELLPGSHHLVAEPSSATAALQALQASGGALAAAPLAAGDALVFDARVLHRGLGNSSYGRCRVVLVLRIDCDDSPPPGCTVLQTCFGRVLGHACGAVGMLYGALPVPGMYSRDDSHGEKHA